MSIKNIQQEKEVKERTIDAREDPKVPESEKAYGEVAYIVGYHNAEWLRDKRSFNFTRAHSVWGSRLEVLWQRSLDHPSRKAGDRAIFRFQDACEGNLDFDDVSPAAAPERPVADRLPPGTPVTHPVWGDDVIRFYRKTDGQIVLDNCGALVPPHEVTPCPN